MYNFLESIHIPVDTAYETFMELGEEALGLDGEEETEDIDMPPYPKANNVEKDIRAMQEVMNNEEAYNKFIEEFKSSNESFKKNVFKSFLKDMYEGS
jgi:hypothetical protein